ncbi:aldehyde dehydrogenase family protein [Streptomyces phyllanthi]|uniref:Aldehyde dehydrogenase family protein n=1 Tax=Streptomyces phyllanthi TaxID=1803180 RepID=A0A5N8VVH2_9ACTN|nr:aldehyde dehydrogenase family protein [Streptomyces phyllanthi]MPY39260.1 aldehyde dehydrogenase family protein [Streptomyces phyllanthi]
MAQAESSIQARIRRGDGSPLVTAGDLAPAEHFVDGGFRPGKSVRTMDVVNPCDGTLFAQVPEGSVEDVDLAVTAARAARATWGRTVPKERSEVLHDTPYGLSASVWTENSRRGLDLPDRLDFGTVWVNAHLVLANEMPWAGFKGSGYGRDLSVYALDDYSRTKHVMHNHSR